ncbi:MAG: FkbM family methyltransferase [Clostridia bacterium]|nr:FkbM family methyltransferase [Clostridia bacterium]
MIEGLLKEKTVWEKLASSDEPIFLYGMGNGADAVLDEFEKLGIKCSGVFASDDFVRGQYFRGFKVRKLSEIEGEYERFTVVLCFASSLPDVIENIIRISKKHRLLIPCVPVVEGEIFNRSFAEKNAEKIDEVYNLLCDDESKRIYSECVAFMLGGELKHLLSSASEKNEIFSGFFSLTNSENYLDLGAYRGDTVDEFLRFCGGRYSSITAVEPSEKTFLKLRGHCGNIASCRCINACVSDKDGTALFSADAGRHSALSENGKSVPCVTVDSLSAECAFTYIKADIEGEEMRMLEGAVNTLKNNRPKLCIAAYHRSEDVFKLPLRIREINPGYSVYLRRQMCIPCWDLNYFCI